MYLVLALFEGKLCSLTVASCKVKTQIQKLAPDVLTNICNARTEIKCLIFEARVWNGTDRAIVSGLNSCHIAHFDIPMSQFATRIVSEISSQS